jgi:hypothetical protein
MQRRYVHILVVKYTVHVYVFIWMYFVVFVHATFTTFTQLLKPKHRPMLIGNMATFLPLCPQYVRFPKQKVQPANLPKSPEMALLILFPKKTVVEITEDQCRGHGDWSWIFYFIAGRTLTSLIKT